MIKRSIVGLVVGAITFALVGLYLNREIGAPLLSNPGPVGTFAVIGGTVGGLIAPLFRRRVKRG